MKKTISSQRLVNLILGTTVIALCIFGYFYYKSLNPVDVVKNIVSVSVPQFDFQNAIYGGAKDFKNAREVLVINGEIVVSDTGNSRLVVFNRNGKFLRELVNKQITDPAGMFWDGTGLWVCDPLAHKIFLMDVNGKIIDTISLNPNALPADVVVDNGFIYWLNNKELTVEKWDLKTKKLVKKFGGAGQGDGQLYYPYSIGVRSGKVYVADSLNNRINIYSTDGKFVTAWAKQKDNQKGGGLSVPRGIVFDRQGRLFTVEGVGHRVTALNQNGEVILNISKTETIGEEVQDMNLPTDITIDDTGRLYVLEHSFKRVLVYKPK